MNFFSQFSVVLFRVVDMVINLRFILCIFIYLFIFTREKKTSKYFGIYIGQYQLIAFFFLCVSKQKKKKFRKILCDCFFFCYIFIYFFCYFSVGFFTVRKSEIIFLIYAYFVAEKKFFSSHLPSPLNGILMFLTIYIIFSTF